MHFREEDLAGIDLLLRAGRVIEAIRTIRAQTGWDLKRAKAFADARGVVPELPDKATDAPLDDSLFRNAHVLPDDSPSGEPLVRFLAELERFLGGLNYVVTFYVAAVDGAAPNVSPHDVVRYLFPDWTDVGEFVLASRAEMQSDVEESLTYEGDESHGPALDEDDRRARLTNELIPQFWRALDQLVSLDSCEIYRRSLYGGVFWDFLYVICDDVRPRFVVLSGTTSD